MKCSPLISLGLNEIHIYKTIIFNFYLFNMININEGSEKQEGKFGSLMCLF